MGQYDLGTMVVPSLGRNTEASRESNARHRWTHGTRHRPCPYSPPCSAITARDVPPNPGTPSVYPQEQRQAATTWYRYHRRSPGTTSPSYGLGAHLRSRLSTVLPWIPPGTQPTYSMTRRSPYVPACLMDNRRRHRRLLRSCMLMPPSRTREVQQSLQCAWQGPPVHACIMLH
jgi:hypothetical protein